MERITWRNERGKLCFRMGDTEHIGGVIAERLEELEDRDEAMQVDLKIEGCYCPRCEEWQSGTLREFCADCGQRLKHE